MRQIEAAVRHYVRAYGLHAVICAAASNGAGIVATGSNVAARVKQLRADHGGSTRVVAVFWCPSAADARKIAAEFRGGQQPAAEAPAMVISVAARLGIALAGDAAVLARAEQVVQSIDRELARMQATGALKAVNAAYKSERLRRQKLGLGMLPYSSYLGRERIRMIYRVGGEMRIGNEG